MRRGTWLLAISGMMALVNGASFAADPSTGTAGRTSLGGGAGESPSRSGRIAVAPASGGLPTRYSRQLPASAPQSKNYYNDLFTEGEAAPTAPATPSSSLGDWSEDAAPKQTARKPAPPAAAPTAAATPAAAKTSALKGAPASTGKVSPVAASSDKPAGPRVIQASYDKAAGSSEKKFIQQVRSEAKSPRGSAPPMPDFDHLADAPSTSPAKASGAPTAPTGRAETGPTTPQVTIEWTKKGDINVGQECQVELHVKNSGSVAASQVAVDAVFPTTVRLTSAEPKPATSADKLTWSFDSIAPGTERKITVKLIPSRRGDLGATAQVRFTGAASASFKVEEPMLKVALKGPNELMLGDPASQFITVSNPGTGTAHDVKVEARLSEGLEHGSRGEKLIMEVGSIGPGETRTVRLGLSAIKGGQQSISVTATSSSDAGGTASAQMNVIAP
ncbi:MAG: DUF11 domain-containing protein, partial [Candidatus Saccharimonas sp.]|nr:DUF11 domain-containing protein [Planctomycetaceae bacterium]